MHNTTVVQPRAYQEKCGNTETIKIGTSSVINNNIWGTGSDGAGKQCVWYDDNGKWGSLASHSSGALGDIKGYPALVQGWIWYDQDGSIWATNDGTYPVRMSQLASVTSSWTVTVPHNGETYDTAYDIWLDKSDNPNYKAQYEVMVWMNWEGSAYNGPDFLPVGNQVGWDVSVAGHSWNTYTGWNGKNNVFSFRRSQKTASFNNLDLLALLKYARDQGFITNDHYLLGIQAGWELVSGGAFQTEQWSLSVKRK